MHYNESTWKYLPRERVENAQGIDVESRAWSCGPESGLRALRLNGDSVKFSWTKFIDNCPRSIGHKCVELCSNQPPSH